MRTNYLILPLLFSSLIGCGGSKSTDNNQPHSELNGIWTSNLYGQSYVIDSHQVEIYQHDSQYCLLKQSITDVDPAELDTIFEHDPGGDFISDNGSNGVQDFHAPATAYYKADTLPNVCATPVKVRGQAGYQRDPQRDFDIFWQTFNDYYLSFELKQADWHALYQQGTAALASTSSDETLMATLYQMITPLADSHVYITSEELGTASVDGKPTLVGRLLNEYLAHHHLALPLPGEHLAAVNSYIEAQLALQQAIVRSYAAAESAIRSAANDQLLWYTLDDIAYLQIRGMSGFSQSDDNAAELAALESALDQVMADIAHTSGLILDIRLNNGGHDFLSMAIASRFVDSQQLAFSKQTRDGNQKSPLIDVYIKPRGQLQYHQPVVLLTSNSTVSAAEVFTLMLRSLPQVTLMGEPTQGALSDVLEKALPNGFKFGLSNEFYYSTQGEWFEHLGIPVDIEVAFFTQEQRLHERDVILEQAYALLTDNQ